MPGGTRGVKIASAGPWLLGVGGVAAVTALATLIAVRDDLRGELSLGLLNPVVGVADEVGRWLLQNPQPWITRVGGAVAILAVVVGTILWWRRRVAAAANVGPILAALGIALIAQLFIFHGEFMVGAIGYAGAVAVIVVAHLTTRRTEKEFESEDNVAPPTYFEAAAFLAIGMVAVFFRYYALNRVFDFFEGELACYMAGATNLHGMLLANIGWEGPWAPMGILFYLPIWAMSAVAGSTVLAVRLGSAVIGILTVVVVYVVVRDTIGRTAALWSAALLSVDTLQVGWGRSDMHPHASTAWPGVLLYGATVRALTTGATGWYVAVMLLMGLSWHQYPSGQFVVIVPVIAFAVHAVQNRGFLGASWRKGRLIVAGAVLWVLGYPLVFFLAVGKAIGPLQYVARLGPRVLGGSDEVTYAGIPAVDLVVTASRGIWDLVQGLFAEAPFIFHQTVIPDVEGLPPRALPWFVAAVAVVGLTLCCLRIREKWSPALLAMMVAGILPAILSDAAWMKRASLLYVVLIIIAAVPLAIVTDGLSRILHRRLRWIGGAILAIAFMLWSSVWVHLWFSGRQYSYGVSAEEVIVEALDKHLEPNTLLIFSLWGDYIEGELVYLVSDAFRDRQPLALYVTSHLNAEWETLLANPSEMLRKIKPHFWYWSWLGLDDEIPKVRKHQGWSRVVYLMQHRPGVESDFEDLAYSCPDIEIEGIFVGDDAEERNDVTLKRYHVWIVRCDHHRDLETDRIAVPARDENQPRRTR
jgi:hypothetical protein